MAVKCFRQALQSLKESSLSDNQKTLKSHEITAIIKELRTVHGFNLDFGPGGGADASERQGCQVSEREREYRVARQDSTPVKDMSRADRKSQVWRFLGCCTAESQTTTTEQNTN